MRRNSITFKLLLFISGAFLIAAVSVIFIGDIQLTRIIDNSQNGIYTEKIEAIWGSLNRSNERLKKTGMVETYSHDFKDASLKNLRQIYYTHANQRIYPFIIDTDGKVVMHPVLPIGDQTLTQSEIVKQMLASNEGDFNYTYHGQKNWCRFLRFQDWNWVIGYTVPLDIKYADALKFRNLLIYIMSGITILVLLVLLLIITKFTRPITRLTKIAASIAEGELNQQIDLGGADEVGVLARSFSHMRDSIQQTISELKNENIERRKVEKKLVEKNEYINSILESVTHPLYAIDVNDYSIKIANSASGFRAGNSSTCYALTHKQDTPCNDIKHPCPLEIVKQTKKPTMVEHIHYDKDGNQKNIEVYAYPVFDSHGELIQMIEYGIDISDRKRALDDLAAEKERLAVTLRSIGDGVITTQTTGNIVLLNKVAEDLTGWRNDKAVGRTLEEVFHIIDDQTGQVYENPATKVVKNGKIIELTNHTVLIARDGTKLNIAHTSAPILDQESNIVGVVLVFRDITKQIKTEKELIKVQKIESVGVLAGGIAHDFNNILAAILGNINLALFDEDLNDRTKRLLSAAEKASLRAKDLTMQLLTFAKGGSPVKEISALKSVIKDSADFVLHGDKVACIYDIPEDLWLVDIDKGQISQVIQNIVINASHAMPEGGAIKISCENLANIGKSRLAFLKEGHFVKISIQDNGTGIPANLIDKIFDPYFSTKQKGSGLGLAITQSIIGKHNGHISVESSHGSGSTFTIYLAASGRTEKKHEDLFAENNAYTKAKVLVMDDEEMVRNITSKMLAHLGHEVKLAADGEEAVKIFQDTINTDRKIDIIIMDLTIPGGMGGKEAVREILAIDPNAKVIVSSGYSNDPVLASFKEYGFCEAIVKPYQLLELSKVINRSLT